MQAAIDVANYFLAKVDDTAGDAITNLKLQKLLYYAQGFHLALYDVPLFKEKLKAWKHGPVVPQVYHHFKDAGELGIPYPAAVKTFPKKITDLLDEVYKVFGQFSAWKLRNLTHNESPWKDTVQPGEITHAALKRYFKTQLV